MSQLKFLYTQSELSQFANDIITRSVKLGASAAQVELSESISTDIEVLEEKIENFETSHESQMLLTVYIGQQKGHIGISNIDIKNLDSTITQALEIAKYTQPDPANGILEEKYLAQKDFPQLNLFSPHAEDNSSLIATAIEIEQRALQSDNQISASDGASVSLTTYNFVTANSNQFNLGYQTSRYSNSVSLIGNTKDGMQTDYWYSSARNYANLLLPKELAKEASSRLLRRLNKGSFKESSCKVIFETNVAKSIIGALIGALSGNSQYRKLSFLNDSLGNKILPKWLDIIENPYISEGLSSCYFDNEGGRVYQRKLIDNGVVAGYLLSAYTSRKLGMAPTGNAGGAHNLEVSSNFAGNLADLAKEMYSGLIIIETIGHGLNSVTGDYSVGASALVVINGEISHFTDNLTISGNMRDIYSNIIHIANDSSPGSLICGSMLIESGCLQISGK
jgi:PmbA protein